MTMKLPTATASAIGQERLRVGLKIYDDRRIFGRRRDQYFNAVCMQKRGGPMRYLYWRVIIRKFKIFIYMTASNRCFM